MNFLIEGLAKKITNNITPSTLLGASDTPKNLGTYEKYKYMYINSFLIYNCINIGNGNLNNADIGNYKVTKAIFQGNVYYPVNNTIKFYNDNIIVDFNNSEITLCNFKSPGKFIVTLIYYNATTNETFTNNFNIYIYCDQNFYPNLDPNVNSGIPNTQC